MKLRNIALLLLLASCSKLVESPSISQPPFKDASPTVSTTQIITSQKSDLIKYEVMMKAPGRVEGMITNVSDNHLEFVLLRLCAADADDVQLGWQVVFPGSMKPHQKWKFSTIQFLPITKKIEVCSVFVQPEAQ